jgi:hypothetical protein
VGDDRQSHRLAGGLFRHEEMAPGIRLQNGHSLVAVRSGRAGALAVALVTVSIQAFRAVRANPVNALKYE